MKPCRQWLNHARAGDLLQPGQELAQAVLGDERHALGGSRVNNSHITPTGAQQNGLMLRFKKPWARTEL